MSLDRADKRPWTDLSPQEAADRKITLPHADYYGPVTQEGAECPWPWDPPQLKNAPLGMYHCPYCGEMVIAGMDHTDYGDEAVEPAA